MEKCRRMKRRHFHVRELDRFLTVKIIEDTPAVFSLGKLLCSRSESSARITDIHGSGPMAKNHVSSKNGCRIQRNTEDCVRIVVPGLSIAFSCSSSSASLTSLPQESAGSKRIPAFNERQMSKNGKIEFQTQPQIQNPAQMRITSQNG